MCHAAMPHHNAILSDPARRVFPKRCGHLDGKALVPTAAMVEKVQRAAAARDAGDPKFIICARSDGQI